MNKTIFCLMIFMLSVMSLHGYYYGKNKIQQEKIEWSVIESRHFDIHYVKGHDEFGKLTLLMAENAYYHLNEFFRIPLRSRIPIIVYSSKQDFHTTNIIYPLLSEGVGGFTETLRNRVALPFDGSYKKFEEVLVHELVHAYINDMNNSLFKNPMLGGYDSFLPFWFSEGLPEYLSVAGTDNHNLMFIKDMVINNQLYDVEYLGGFFAYRLGEAILVWISEIYGEDKVVEYFYNLRIQSNIQTATKTTFGFDFKELQNRFHLYLKREYSDLLHDFDAPWENHTRHTEASKSKERQNVFPRLSKTGNEFVYFSSNIGRTVIRFGSSLKLFDDRVILTGERTGNFEEFHFQRNNLSWFPDNRHIAFVSKTSRGDEINIYDTQRRRIRERIRLRQFDSIYELDVSPDGKTLAITAQLDNRCDVYLYTLNTKALKQITDDPYIVYQPNFSPDGTKLAFVTERVNQQSESPLIFHNLVNNVYYYDLNTEQIFQITFDDFNNNFPVWVSDDKVMFLTEKTKISNIDIIDITDNTRATVTNVLSGIQSFDYNAEKDLLIYSTYFETAYDIFSTNPFKELEFTSYHTNSPIEFIDDFHENFNTHEYRLHGRPSNKATEPEEKLPSPEDEHETHRQRRRGERVRSAEDFLSNNRNFRLSIRPDSTNYTPPVIRDYKPVFGIDTLWGGMGYSGNYGAFGMLQLGLSDMMGDHGIGVNLEFRGKLEDSNIVLSYMYLPYRIDYGFAVFNFSDYFLTRFQGRIFELRDYQTGGYFLIRYPLSRFFRFDFQNYFYKYKREQWRYEGYDIVNLKEVWTKLGSNTDYVYLPSVGFVFDNALYGSTGPMSGVKLTSFVRHSFSKAENSFTTVYNDWRSYLPISYRFAFANRVVYGHSEGENPERFNLTGFHGVRGFDDSNHRGSKKAMTSLELRYPFIDRLNLSFPLPISFTNLRGSIFTDLGAVWDAQDFRGAKDGALNDIKLGFGFGPRLNVGFFILKLDMAWSSDLSNHSKPSFFFTINEDF